MNGFYRKIERWEDRDIEDIKHVRCDSCERK